MLKIALNNYWYCCCCCLRKFCVDCLAETMLICILSRNYVFSCAIFIELFIEITHPIIKIYYGTNCFGETCSATIFALS